MSAANTTSEPLPQRPMGKYGSAGSPDSAMMSEQVSVVKVGGTTKRPFVPCGTEGFVVIRPIRPSVLRIDTEDNTMSYRYQRRPPRRGNGCLGWTVAMIWIAVVAVAAYLFWLRPQLSRMLGEQVVRQVDAGTVDGATGALPTTIAALPRGEVSISEQEVNAYLAANTGAMAPIEQATVRFTSGGVEADLRALGLDGTARMGLAVQNGRVIAIAPHLDGPLGQVVAFDDLLQPIERQFNDQLAAQGRRITDLRIEPGTLVVIVEG